MMCLMAIAYAWGESINESQALSIAKRFAASHKLQSTSLKLEHKATRLNATTGGNKAAYYVFNASNRGGYVIVAGDDRAPAVLGYSDKGTFDSNNLPEAMQDLLEGYAAQIEALDHGAKAEAVRSAGAAISPLVHATWSQNAPYNILLPYVGGSHAVTGCVATAMAQVMHYWQWPARPTQTIPAYTTSTKHIYRPALEPVDFDWQAMHDTYLTTDTLSNEALAAARLLVYCDQSVEMDFMNGVSGAPTSRVPSALSTYFGYKGSAHTLKRVNYTSQQWTDTIYHELASQRPVIYSGSKRTGGHAFVCDGYDGNGLFHINWGWNGQSNGYFLLNVLNADAQGTGSASGTYGYIYDQGIIVGIEPGEAESEFVLTSANVRLEDAVTTRESISGRFSVTVTSEFHNLTSKVMIVSYGWGLFQDGVMVKQLYNTFHPSLHPSSYVTLRSAVLNFGDGIRSGTYRILPICARLNESDWRPCIGADNNYIEVTIDGNTCTLQKHGSFTDPDYQVNDITVEGLMHNGRPVDINVGLTNQGEWSNRLLHAFANGTFISSGYVSLGNGESGVIPFQFMPSTPGEYTITFSWNEDGSDPIASRTITISEMPEAHLTATAQVLNVTDPSNMVITSDKFSLVLTITNNGSTVYHEDISAKLYKDIGGGYGNGVQGQNKVITLQPGESTDVQFDLDNVTDAWRYFAFSFYYSKGQQVQLAGTAYYTIHIPNAPQVLLGDADGDGEVGINDVSVIIDYLLSGGEINALNADMDQSGEVEINDVAVLVDYLLAR